MEWQLVFHFVLHFPSVVAEAVVMRRNGEGRRDGRGEGAGEQRGGGGGGRVNLLKHMEISIKKVFLCFLLFAVLFRFGHEPKLS